MTPLDWGIAAFLFLVSLWGFRQGFIVGVLGLAGLAIGAVAGSRVAPILLEGGSTSAYAPLTALVGAVLVGGIALAIGLGAGERVRDSALQHPFLRILDGIGGALLIAAVGLGLIWVIGVVAIYYPGANGIRSEVQRSYLLGGINRVMPPSGPLLKVLHRIDPVPRIASSPNGIAPPARGTGTLPAVRTATNSVVRISGTACGIGVMGSGWPVADGLFVTNAHVVAGEGDTTVEANDGRTAPATVVAFNPKNDIAVLRAAVSLSPLAMSTAVRTGSAAAVIGYPLDGPLTVTPARLGATRTVLTGNAYGSGPVERQVLTLRGQVRHGNSGGPIVDRAGRVAGTVFAATTQGPTGGLAVPNRVLAQILRGATGPVSTGSCAR